MTERLQVPRAVNEPEQGPTLRAFLKADRVAVRGRAISGAVNEQDAPVCQPADCFLGT